MLTFGADGRTTLVGLQWSRWGEPSAVAQGTWKEDIGPAGEPQYIEAPATLTASAIERCDGLLTYTRLALSSQNPEAGVYPADLAKLWAACVPAAQPKLTNPCTSQGASIGARLLSSIRCTAHELALDTQCGVAVASLIFLPLKALKLVEAARSVTVIDKLPTAVRPAARFLYHLTHARFSKHAPAGFRDAAETLRTLKKVRYAYQLVLLLPKLAKAASHADFSQIALDLDEIAGLKPCVQAVADGLAG